MNGHIIPHTSIAVDYWAKNKGKYLHFLTHCHADHMKGLTDRWKEPIYTSEFNIWMLQQSFNFQSSQLKPLKIGETHIIKGHNQQEFLVTPFGANHCPGAVMYLFEGYFGTILYTGDFRYHPDILKYPQLVKIAENETLDILYVDNTYASIDYDFPKRPQAEKEVINIIKKHPDYKIYIGIPNLGKEELLQRIALSLNELVCIDERRMNIMKKLNYEDVFTCDQKESRIHVVSRSFVSVRHMMQKRREDPKQIAILPTALLRRGNGKFPIPSNSEYHGIYVVPYSDHSSFTELYTFISKLKPAKLVPIVRSAESPDSSDISHWEYLKTISKIPSSLKALCRKVKQTKQNDHVQGYGEHDDCESTTVVSNSMEKKFTRSNSSFRRKRVPRVSDKKGVNFDATFSSDEESYKIEYEDDVKLEEISVTLPDATSYQVKAPQNIKDILCDVQVKLYDINCKDSSQDVKNSLCDMQVQLVDDRKTSLIENLDNDFKGDDYLSTDQNYIPVSFSLENSSVKKDDVSDCESIHSAVTVVAPYNIQEKSIVIKERFSDTEGDTSNVTKKSKYNVKIFCDDTSQMPCNKSQEYNNCGNSNFEIRRENSLSDNNIDSSQIMYTYECVPEFAPVIVNTETLKTDLISSIPSVDLFTDSDIEPNNSQVVHVVSVDGGLTTDPGILNMSNIIESISIGHGSQSVVQWLESIPEKPQTETSINQSSNLMIKSNYCIPTLVSFQDQASDQVGKDIPEKPNCQASGQVRKNIARKINFQPYRDWTSDQVTKNIATKLNPQPYKDQSSNQVRNNITEKANSQPYRDWTSNQVRNNITEKPNSQPYRSQTSNQNHIHQLPQSYGSQSSEAEFFTCPSQQTNVNITSYPENEEEFFSCVQTESQNMHHNNLELSQRASSRTQVKLMELSGELELIGTSRMTVSESSSAELQHLTHMNKYIQTADEGNNKGLTPLIQRTNSLQSSSTVNNYMSTQSPGNSTNRTGTDVFLSNSSGNEKDRFQENNNVDSLNHVYENNFTSANEKERNAFLLEGGRIQTEETNHDNYWENMSNCAFETFKLTDTVFLKMLTAKYEVDKNHKSVCIGCSDRTHQNELENRIMSRSANCNTVHSPRIQINMAPGENVHQSNTVAKSNIGIQTDKNILLTKSHCSGTQKHLFSKQSSIRNSKSAECIHQNTFSNRTERTEKFMNYELLKRRTSTSNSEKIKYLLIKQKSQNSVECEKQKVQNKNDADLENTSSELEISGMQNSCLSNELLLSPRYDWFGHSGERYDSINNDSNSVHLQNETHRVSSVNGNSSDRLNEKVIIRGKLKGTLSNRNVVAILNKSSRQDDSTGSLKMQASRKESNKYSYSNTNYSQIMGTISANVCPLKRKRSCSNSDDDTPNRKRFEGVT